MSAEEVWRRKSDEELLAASRRLDEYTEDGHSSLTRSRRGLPGVRRSGTRFGESRHSRRCSLHISTERLYVSCGRISTADRGGF